MIFRWLKNRRRAALTGRPFPDAWNQIIAANVHHDRFLSVGQRAQLRRFVQILVAEKNWEGCNGQLIDDEVRVTIAAQAALLTFTSDDFLFDHVLSVLVYPDAYWARGLESTGGIVTETQQHRLGEAVWQGPIVLSWDDVLSGGRRECRGSNLVLHEFAHQLDMMNGRFIDGIPPLKHQSELDRWVDVMQPAHEQLLSDCSHRRANVIDCYGATNAAEFFAVATETFFENSRALFRHNPELYTLFKDYFGLDPMLWATRES